MHPAEVITDEMTVFWDVVPCSLAIPDDGVSKRLWNIFQFLPHNTAEYSHLHICEISSCHGGEYEVRNCILGCTAVHPRRQFLSSYLLPWEPEKITDCWWLQIVTSRHLLKVWWRSYLYLRNKMSIWHKQILWSVDTTQPATDPCISPIRCRNLEVCRRLQRGKQ
jgi:hypothetical protein